MGLDMFAFTTSDAIPAVDFKHPNNCPQIFYWRKHPNLHGWMEELYRSKGGSKGKFNCVCLRLDQNDLESLEKAINENNLPLTTGFFFGESDGSEKLGDIRFIHKARDAIGSGNAVFYTSWW